MEVVMSRAREILSSLVATPYHHRISHCVRHAWLYGAAPYTDQRFKLTDRYLINTVTQVGLS